MLTLFGMTPLTALWILGAVLLTATVIGFICTRGGARVRHSAPEKVEQIVASDLGLKTDAAFGERATLVQFSTQFCSKCPATARLLSHEADELEGVTHLDIDLTDQIEIARRFNVLQTPTTLVLDGAGQLRARITGAPTSSVIRDELHSIGALPYHIERAERVS